MIVSELPQTRATSRRSAARRQDLVATCEVLHADGPPEAPAAKHDLILQAARRVFLRAGYAASMDLVAAEAGVSKQTVYNHFRHKTELFQAIVKGLREEFLSVFDDPHNADEAPAQVLSALARQFLSLALAPCLLGLHRMLVAEAPRFPDLAKEVYGAGSAQLIVRLASYLEEQDRKGVLRVRDPALAAEQFLGAFCGQIHLRAVLGVRPAPPQAELDRAVSYAVECFLRAHQRS